MQVALYCAEYHVLIMLVRLAQLFYTCEQICALKCSVEIRHEDEDSLQKKAISVVYNFIMWWSFMF